MKHTVYICIALLLSIMLPSCGEYQQLLKSRDPDLKYEKAMDYFNEGKYIRSQTLLEDVASYYKGTERAQEVMAYIARSYLGQKSYTSAAEYYEVYLKNYPKGRYAMEARYQIGHCYFLDSPDARLDQELTRKAIQSHAQFVELYPESQYAEQAWKEMAEMYDKLALKELKNAQLYYNLGTYLGNNFLSCEIVARNALKNYPGNSYQEELSWLILAAKYQQTVYSTEDKKQERARDAEDEYYSFKTEYPESKHIKDADKMHAHLSKILK